jgi:tetratricopeptide (TPR) repeat protein
VPPVSPKSALSNLPERNPFFTGRERVLAELQEALTMRGRAALTGLGGVGKTQTVLEYAHRHLKKYEYVFLATANSREALLSSYVTIAGLVKLPAADIQDQILTVEALKSWFTSNQGWLLILDNADDLSMTRAFFPTGNNGYILLTTRALAVGTMAQRVEVREMGVEEGALFVLRRANRLAKDEPLGAATETDQARAKEIVVHLGGLPLALHQAAAYVEETGCGLLGYLDIYRNYAPKLLQRRGMLTFDYPESVATTWVLSFERIERANLAAAELLRFCAFLHADGIPEEVIRGGVPELGPVLGSIASDAIAWNDALSEILKYSLLRRDPNLGILEIHRLVQAVLKQAMDESVQRLWAKRAVRAVNRAFPNAVEFSSWAVCERLLSVAYACAELVNQWSFEFLEVARLLNELGFYLKERGRYSDAEPFYERSMAIREKVLGAEHPDLATSLNNLAVLHDYQGQYAKAEPLYQRALAIREKALGPEHPDVANSFNCLGAFYTNQGKYAKAAPLYQRALAIREKALIPEHPDVATSLNNLASLHDDQGQYAKAEPLYKRALAIRENTLGQEHPDVANSFNCLGVLCTKQGKYAKAEPLYQRARAIYEKALGPEHPNVASVLNNWAGLYRVQCQYANAKLFYERALAIWEKALNPEHPKVAMSLNNLADLCVDQGQYAKAKPLYQQALTIYEKAFGSGHPNVATCLKNYALCLRATGRFQAAEPLEARARAIQAKSDLIRNRGAEPGR